MLKLIATWNVACKSTAQAADIADPGTRDTLESIYRRMFKVSYRVAETLRVLNLRTTWFGVEFAQKESCTAEELKKLMHRIFMLVMDFCFLSSLQTRENLIGRDVDQFIQFADKSIRWLKLNCN